MGERDAVEHALLRDVVAHGAERHVVREEHEAHLVDDHHHRRLARRELAQDLGLALVVVARLVHRLLVQRSRHHRVDRARHAHLACVLRPANGRFAEARRDDAPLVDVHVDARVVDHLDRPRRALRVARPLDLPERDLHADCRHRLLEDTRVAEHDRDAPLRGARIGQRLDRGFRPDTGGVAHGDRDAGTIRHDCTPSAGAGTGRRPRPAPTR